MTRGKLRIYLGAAPGVGKTYAMLNEARRGASRGTDAVVAYVDTHGRPQTEAQLEGLELIPRRAVPYRGQELEEMDLDAVLARHPTLALVDELAHSNVPGSHHDKRWEDIVELLEAGINVISTVNIQHLESLNDVVQSITGVAQRETIPDWVVRQADAIELVDMSPDGLRRRLAHGNVYQAERVDAALANYFRLGNLAALRELALLWLADQVDDELHAYRERHGIEQPWETKERVVVALTGSAQGERMIRRAARMAARTRAELVGVHVRDTDAMQPGPDARIESHRALLAELGGRYAEVVGNDPASALVDFAQSENATQLLLGSSGRSRWAEAMGGSVINRVIRQAGSIDVHVISAGGPDDESDARPVLPHLPRRRHLARLSPRRVAAGWVLGVVGMPLLVVAFIPLRSWLGPTGALPELLLGVVIVAAVGGAIRGLVAAVLTFGFADWFLIPPVHSFTISRAGDAGGLVSFLVAAAIVAGLIDLLARRATLVARSQAEAEALARLAGGSVLSGRGALPSLVDELRSTFALDAVAVLRRDGPGDGADDGPWVVEVATGTPVPATPAAGQFTAELAAGSVLVLAGSTLPMEDRRLLSAFVAQLRLAQEQERLQQTAAGAESLAAADQWRTVLLAAVSRDLRTPLASIKAAATRLLTTEVAWPPAAARSLVETIDAEAVRLDALVGNLLDLSQLQAGALASATRPSGLAEVVVAALASLSGDTSGVEVDVPQDLPRVLVDPALLERSLANLVANALAWSRPGAPVRVEAGAYGDRVDLRVVDRGKGIPERQREAVFQPFERLGDGTRTHAGGVGLSLAVARGLVEAMAGELTLDDTPGGGLTATISLRAKPA